MMNHRFFELSPWWLGLDSEPPPDQAYWHLQLPVSINYPGTLRKFRPTDLSEPVPVEISSRGKPADFNQTLSGGLVVSKRLARLIERVAPGAVQRLKAALDAPCEWALLVPLDGIDCIDHARSRIQYYPTDKPWRLPHPSVAGKPNAVFELRIDTAKAAGHHLFVPVDWTVTQIVSGELKKAIEDAGMTGMHFTDVT